jgi:hypothetical protein
MTGIFVVSLADNGSYAFGRDGGSRCLRCNAMISKKPTDARGVTLADEGLELSCTYDGVDICSRGFHELYERNLWSGLSFHQLDRHPDFFAFAAETSVAFDVERRKTRFEDRCSECSRWRSVSGATPAFLMPRADVPARAFRRTDIEFGSLTEWGLDEQQPLLLCGEAVADALHRASLRGIDSITPVEVTQSAR